MSKRIQFLKFVDGLIGSLLVMLLPRPKAAELRLRKVLVLRPGGIGDAVLLLPVIKVFAEQFPGVVIDVLAEKRNAGIFQLTHHVHKVFFYDRVSDWPHFLNGAYDCIIDTEQWHRLSAVVSRLIPSAVKIGFSTNDRQRMFTSLVDYCQDAYEVPLFFRLFTQLGVVCREGATLPFIEVSPSVVSRARDLLLLADEKQVIVVFPGATIEERRWGTTCFSHLSSQLATQGYFIAVVGGHDIAAESKIIASKSGGISYAGQTSLEETAAIITQASLVVSGDSGILHLAVGLGVPTVSLFGPGIQEKWGPRGDNHIIINKNLPCSPCTKFGYTPKCPYSARCMKEITVEEVEAAVVTLLERTKDRRREMENVPVEKKV